MTSASIALDADRPGRSFVADVWRRTRRNPGALAGAAVVLAILLVAIFAPLFAHADPLAQNLAAQDLPPGSGHPFGTDKLGRDLFARIAFGARISIAIGFVAVGLAITLGTAIGTLAGYLGGWVDSTLMGAMDVMLAFPSIILAIGITTILGPSITNLMLAIGIVYIPQYARLARAAVLDLREADFIEATAELEAAGLSYLGLGARPPAPEWGAMLNDARDYWLSAPWALVFPGLSITVLVLGFNLLGDGLRDALDPKS